MAIKPKSASSMAVDGIVSFIRTNHLHSGDALPSETELCETLDCSRSSVREAMRALSSLDIVEVRHGHGTYVSGMSLEPLVRGMVLRVMLNVDDSLKDLEHVVDLRAAFDHALADELAERWKGQDISPILAVVDKMRAKHVQGVDFAEEDREFHRLLLAPISNPLIKELSDAFWQVHMEVLPLVKLSMPEDVQVTLGAHESMIRALHDGDATRFSELVDTHYTPLRRSIARQISAAPESQPTT